MPVLDVGGDQFPDRDQHPDLELDRDQDQE